MGQRFSGANRPTPSSSVASSGSSQLQHALAQREIAEIGREDAGIDAHRVGHHPAQAAGGQPVRQTGAGADDHVIALVQPPQVPPIALERLVDRGPRGHPSNQR
jgi:hypothetical protein